MSETKVTLDMLEENDDGELQLSERGVEFMNIIETRIEARADELVETMEGRVEAYVDLELEPLVESTTDDLRKLMLLAVAEIGGQEKATAFIRKVATLARAGALSSATGQWAAGADDASEKNRHSVDGNGQSRPTSTAEEYERAAALSVFEEVTEDLDVDQVEKLQSLCENVEFDGDEEQLRKTLVEARDSYIDAPQVHSYSRAISKSVRK
jgi:hypothetical protein